MVIQEAQFLLHKCTRTELRDNSVNDVDVSWFLDNRKIAGGYFTETAASVWINDGKDIHIAFHEHNARELRDCGRLVF